MMKKISAAILCAFCTIIAIISYNTPAIFASESANTNNVFLIGSAEDNVISSDFSISDYVTYYKKNGLGIPVYAVCHRDLEVSESNVNELKNKMEYPGVEISVSYGVNSNANVEFKRWDNGAFAFDIYSLDIVEWPNEENINIVKTFQCQTNLYMLLVKNEKFCIAKKG